MAIDKESMVIKKSLQPLMKSQLTLTELVTIAKASMVIHKVSVTIDKSSTTFEKRVIGR